jgi:DNA-3-methyladenine glycosylase
MQWVRGALVAGSSRYHRDNVPEPIASLPKLLRATVASQLSFFRRSTVDVARDLIGAVLVHAPTAGMIVETEAYLGGDDAAAHSARGKTERTKVIFGPPGRAYVYFIYGMHECLNVVAKLEEQGAGCVLIRALEPLCGVDEMRLRRHWNGPAIGLANGPGKLTQAMDITRRHYGQRLDQGSITIRLWREQPSFQIAVTPRIGISQCADWPLRFVWSGHPCVSK